MYDYLSCDGNAGRKMDEYHAMTCNLCELTFNYDCGSRSRLNGEWYCDQCKEILIAEDEREYPGSRGNHKSLTDFD
jgi:hypothetical protein